MNARLPIISFVMLSGLLLGCEQRPVATAPPPLSQAGAQPAPTGRDTVSTVDPSLPSLNTSAQSPKSGTDAKAGSTLTQAERDTQMPLPGQVNDHSSPAIAKQGDSKASAKTTK